MITMLINRMLLTSGAIEVYPGDPAGRETPFRASSDRWPEMMDIVAEEQWSPNSFELDTKKSVDSIHRIR